MDGTAGITSAAEQSTTAAQSHFGSPTSSEAVTEASGATAGTDKQQATGAPALDGNGAVMNCHISGSGQSDSSQTAAVNGPASASPGFIIRTSLNVQNTSSSSGNSSQASEKTVPTVALVRPPMHTSTNESQSTDGSNAVLSSGSVSVSSKTEPAKTVTQTGAQVLPSGVLTATIRSPTVLQNLRTSSSSTISATPPGGIRTIAPQVLAPRLTQPHQNATSIQNIQLPPGMVLVRSESGQLLMIHQQTLAQMQAQAQSQSATTPRPAAPTSTPPVQVTSLQTPVAPLLARSVTPTTIIKQGSPVQTTVATTTTLQRPPVLQNTIILGGNATSTGQALGTPTTVQATAAVTQRMGPIGTTGVPVTPTAITAETLENVKKCRNFLSTLIKLASNGKQSTETTASVKELVRNLLEGKIEPEDFTSRLYKELNSSPQPYLVPFLKRSLPALRQMTPDSEAFIQQSLLPQPSSQPAATASAALSAVVLRPPLSPSVTAATGTTTTKTTVITLSQKANSKPGLVVAQQQQVRPQVTVAQSPLVTIRGAAPSRIIVGQPQMVRQISPGSVVKPIVAPGVRGVQLLNQSSLVAAQKNKLKEAGGGTFKDDDDINDVASMAGVNLSEENARIMASSSELVGIVTRSCKDEAFLSISSLTQIVLQIGKRFGVSELGTDVISYISHATQQRLQNLLENASQVAQLKNINFKEDERCEQVSDVRAQLKFFEQLDQMEKQRKEEQEREILLKAAKSRSRQEDPEQLRLKQKAKEMQQLELAQIRQREANLTALAAIGPRKKRKTDSPLSGASGEGSGSGSSQPGGSSGGSRQFMRQRITRVNLRDLLLCLENDRDTSHSQLLYKGLLK
ncbi:transcription initiation factor TFIID subunit 4-like [Anableps anableps]